LAKKDGSENKEKRERRAGGVGVGGRVERMDFALKAS